MAKGWWQVRSVAGILAVTCLVNAKYYTKEPIPEDYMNKKCGQTIGGAGASGHLESSHALTYDNLMNCDVTLSVTPGQRTLIHVNRFELEEAMSGSCVDSLNLYDGSSASGPVLNPSPLCGLYRDPFNYTSSGDKVTLRMVTDNTAVFRGFEIVYVAVTTAPCGGDQFTCGNGYCIASKLECNRVNECGDATDEANCEEEDVTQKQTDVGLIIGFSILGLLLIIILCVVAYKVYQYYIWKRWMRFEGRVWETDYDRVYPVSDKYSRFDERISGRRAPHPGWEDQQISAVPSSS